MTKPRLRKEQPLIYSCSGCSSAAQVANAVAVRLDRNGDAEMSCIAGVGGDVPALVRVATSGRPVRVIDGCPLQCARHCLARHRVTPEKHYILSDFDVKKVQHGNSAPEDIDRIYEIVKDDLIKVR